MNDETRATEPLLVSGMRRHPTGEVRHVPAPPIGACGTSTAGFLRELDEWAAAVRAATLREAADYCERPDEPTGCCGVISAVDLRRLAASPAPTETHCARCTSFAPDCPYCQTAQADLARATSDHGAVEQRWVPMEASRRIVTTCSDCAEVIPAGESHACRWIGTTS